MYLSMIWYLAVPLNLIDIRLTKKGIDAGLVVSPERIDMLRRREEGINFGLDTLTALTLPRTTWTQYGEKFHMRQKDGKHKNAVDVLSMPDTTLQDITTIVRSLGVDRNDRVLAEFEVDSLVYDTVEAISKYSNYLSRQEDEMKRWRKSGSMRLPDDIEYTKDTFSSFSSEKLEKLRTNKPATLHHTASQIQGITPHALIYLHSYIREDDIIKIELVEQPELQKHRQLPQKILIRLPQCWKRC